MLVVVRPAMPVLLRPGVVAAVSVPRSVEDSAATWVEANAASCVVANDWKSVDDIAAIVVVVKAAICVVVRLDVVTFGTLNCKGEPSRRFSPRNARSPLTERSMHSPKFFS
jgi:hypothetical protein